MCVLSLLFVISIFSTCTIGSDALGESSVFYNRDYPLIHILAFFFLIGIIYWLKRIIKQESYRQIARLAVVVWGVAALIWVFLYLDVPVHDSANVLLAAKQMRQYNFSSFVDEGYLNIWSGNRKLALCFYLLSFFDRY